MPIPIPGYQTGLTICKSSDDNLILGGYDQGTNLATYNALVAKVDLSGNLIWQNVFGSTFVDKVWEVVSDGNGGCVIAGATRENLERSSFIAKIDNAGTLSGYADPIATVGKSNLLCLQSFSNNGFVAGGILKEAGDSHDYPTLFFFNSNLELIDFQKIETDSDSEFASMKVLADGDFILTGKVSTDAVGYDVLISRIDSNPNEAGIVEVESLAFHLFPNPFTEVAYLNVPSENGDKVLSLYNFSGELVKTIKFTESEVFIYREDLAAGMYTFQVNYSNGKGIVHGKVMVE